MNVFSIALKSLRQRRVASLLTGLSVSLGVALMVAVLVLNNFLPLLISLNLIAPHVPGAPCPTIPITTHTPREYRVEVMLRVIRWLRDEHTPLGRRQRGDVERCRM